MGAFFLKGKHKNAGCGPGVPHECQGTGSKVGKKWVGGRDYGEEPGMKGMEDTVKQFASLKKSVIFAVALDY